MTAPGDNAARTLTGRRLGLVGLGRMGLPMARNLLKAGARLTVFNRTAAAAEGFVRDSPGAVAAATPAAVVAASEITIVNVSDTPAVESLMTGPQGCSPAFPRQRSRHES
jgi:3-hydroxyisobutyrate dehydrogenase-like beta-hydroxyacid dehydrogenase